MCCDELASLSLQLHRRRRWAERETEKASLPGPAAGRGASYLRPHEIGGMTWYWWTI
jgi:hypothetical protein